jgi:hypothetical protein
MTDTQFKWRQRRPAIAPGRRLYAAGDQALNDIGRSVGLPAAPLRHQHVSS